jgi:hypothetical protein
MDQISGPNPPSAAATDPAGATGTGAPLIHFARPPGFIPVEMDPDYPRMREMFAAGSAHLSQAEIDQWSDGLAAMAVVLAELRASNTVYYAVGAHPDGRGGVTTATMAITVVASPLPVPDRDVIATTALQLLQVGSTTGEVRTERLDLGCGPGVAIEDVVRFPAISGTGDTGAAASVAVARTRIAVPLPDGEALAVLDMATPFLDEAENYRDILYGVAHTIAFDTPAHPLSTVDFDPHPDREPASGSARPGDRIRDVLG